MGVNWRREGWGRCGGPEDLKNRGSKKRGKHWENRRILMRDVVVEGMAGIREQEE